MEINDLKELSYDELRTLYKNHLTNQYILKNTINTIYADTFYLWRNGNKNKFWGTVTANDFENEARLILTEILSEKSSGNVENLVKGYMSHLRRFRRFINSKNVLQEHTEYKNLTVNSLDKVSDNDIPQPTVNQVEYYLKKWSTLENYHLQENALNKLFLDLCPENKDISDILLKSSTLNDFYSTNIFSIYPVAKHIHSLNIDDRLKRGDETLVRDIQNVTIGNKTRKFYSFATKYCSHHKPLYYPIYDSYVDEVLRYYRKHDNFSNFKNNDLKDYSKFKNILIDFRDYYGLDKFNLKQIDQYIWQLGRDYFPKKY